jgi:hypothetical protein
MSQRVEVLPVTAGEVIRILGQLKMEGVERLLDDMKMLREGKLFGEELILVRIKQVSRENTK